MSVPNYNIPYYPLKTEAQKKAIAKQWEEYWAVPGNREAWYEAMSEGQDEEWLAKVTAKNRAKSQDPEWLAKITEINRTRIEKYGEEYRLKLSEGQKKRYENFTDEDWEKMSQVAKERWEDDEYRDRMMAYYSTPEYREYIQKRNKEVAQRPEMREWYKEFNKAKREDPEHIKRHAKGVKDRSNNNKEWIRKNCRPVDTPYGVFEKAKDVMDVYYQENGGKRESVAVKLRSWLKSEKKPEWKYLTWDEYDKIKENVE